LLNEGALAGNPKASIIPDENKNILAQEFQNAQDVARIGADSRINAAEARADAMERIAAANNATKEKTAAGHDATRLSVADVMAGGKSASASGKMKNVADAIRIINQDPRLQGVPLDPVQSTAIANEMIRNGGDLAAAYQKNGINPTNIPLEDVTKSRGVIGDVLHGGGNVTGKHIKGFNPGGSGVIAPQQTQAQPQAIQATSQADIDKAPSGAIIIVNGKRYRKP
jgi:hypothetical protein